MATEAEPRIDQGDADTAVFNELQLDSTSYEFERVFGPKNLHNIPISRINAVSQMRTLYEEEPLEELAASVDLHDLMHQLTVRHLATAELAQEYLDGINKIWGSEHTLDELTPLDTGGYVIVIAGHRRYFAMQRIVENRDYDPEQIGVVCNVHEELVTYEALKRQMSENVMAPPKPYELAYVITELYETGLAEGRFTSIAAFAAELPYSEDKVRNAVRYSMLPGKVRELVETDKMTYTASLELVPLIQFYLEQEEDNRIIAETVYNFAIKALLNGWGKPRMQEVVRSTINDLRVEISQGQLLEDAQASEFEAKMAQIRADRKKIINDFSRESIARFNFLLSVHDQGVLSNRDEIPVLLEDSQLRGEMQTWAVLMRRLIGKTGLESAEVKHAVDQVAGAFGLEETERLL